MIRNLLYNCCPLKGAESVTRDNIAWLCKYAEAFSGRAIVHLKTGDDLEKPVDVIPLFNALKPVEFYELPNDPAIGETAGFVDGLMNLKSLDANEATFYAHTKGVATYNRVPENRLESVRQWYRRMYHECLSNPERIEAALIDHATCGAFYRKRPIRHYAGAFYWMRHDRLFNTDKWTYGGVAPDILDKFTNKPSTSERKRFFVETFLSAVFGQEDFYDLYPIHENHNFYVMPHKRFRCKRCGEFVADHRVRVQCPKCRSVRVDFIGWPELGY